MVSLRRIPGWILLLNGHAYVMVAIKYDEEGHEEGGSKRWDGNQSTKGHQFCTSLRETAGARRTKRVANSGRLCERLLSPCGDFLSLHRHRWPQVSSGAPCRRLENWGSGPWVRCGVRKESTGVGRKRECTSLGGLQG
jgi:hypothetical protein